MKSQQQRFRKRRYLATDHRAAVLEEVATCPTKATHAQILDACASDTFSRKNVEAMVWILRREGLIARDDNNGHFLTQAGLDWLTHGRFDKALPTYAERPGARVRKQKGQSK